MMMKKRKIFLSCLISIVVASAALAVPVDNSTSQMWGFSTPDLGPMLPDVFDNDYGQPLLLVGTPYHMWYDVYGTHQGVWHLSGQLDVYIPNYPVLRDYKEILVELTWKTAGSPNPFLPGWPVIGVTANPFDSMEMSIISDEDLGDGWAQTTYLITLWPNPIEEWLTIKGDILVDALAIQTYCIPEPATIALLGLGALALLRKRRA